MFKAGLTPVYLPESLADPEPNQPLNLPIVQSPTAQTVPSVSLPLFLSSFKSSLAHQLFTTPRSCSGKPSSPTAVHCSAAKTEALNFLELQQEEG